MYKFSRWDIRNSGMSIGDPFGGPAYRKYQDPVTAAIGSAVAGPIIGGLFGGNNGGSSSDAAANAANVSSGISQDQWNYYKQNYQPLESNLIQQAQTAGSPEEFAAAAGRANADVTGSMNQANQATASRMQSYGINPGSPAYQSTMQSGDIAAGATKAGALTQAYNNQKALAYSKALDVVGLGRNIPAQSAASAANAAGAATNASRNQFQQNQANMQNAGYAVNNLTNAAQKWYNSTPTNNLNLGSTYNPADTSGASSAFGGYAEGGPVSRFARAGIGSHVITPHMRTVRHGSFRYAQGGGVGTQGNAMPDRSNMGNTIDNETGQVIGDGTETSDSVPAQIDGQEPAALSSGEFVMNAEVPKLTGDEILAAINDAGLRKRRAGIGPRDSNEVSQEAGMEAYAEGGPVDKVVNAASRGIEAAAPYVSKAAEGVKNVSKAAWDSMKGEQKPPGYNPQTYRPPRYAMGGPINRATCGLGG